MLPDRSSPGSYLRALLILGRTSNLPTVWSNCLVGWFLAGQSDLLHLVMLLAGASFLYLGGMYLNDAFDAAFDRQYRPERPIPAGVISVEAVWQWGFSWLGLGLLCLSLISLPTALIAVALAGTILLYDAVHKIFFLSPIIMAACRALLILAAASAADPGLNGLTIWTALVLAAYVVGLSFLARRESAPGPLQYWPVIFLLTPIVLAFIINRGPYFARGLFFSLLLVAWVAYCLIYTYWTPRPNVGHSVSGLLAGIILVDLLAVAGGPLALGLPLAALFLAAPALHRVIPAT